MGVDAGESYPDTTIDLSPGDNLVFYTDGDGQYDVRELPVLLMLLTDDTDFVNGIKMTRQDPSYRVHAGNIHQNTHHQGHQQDR